MFMRLPHLVAVAGAATSSASAEAADEFPRAAMDVDEDITCQECGGLETVGSEEQGGPSPCAAGGPFELQEEEEAAASPQPKMPCQRAGSSAVHGGESGATAQADQTSEAATAPISKAEGERRAVAASVESSQSLLGSAWKQRSLEQEDLQRLEVGDEGRQSAVRNLHAFLRGGKYGTSVKVRETALLKMAKEHGSLADVPLEEVRATLAHQLHLACVPPAHPPP